MARVSTRTRREAQERKKKREAAAKAEARALKKAHDEASLIKIRGAAIEAAIALGCCADAHALINCSAEIEEYILRGRPRPVLKVIEGAPR